MQHDGDRGDDAEDPGADALHRVTVGEPDDAVEQLDRDEDPAEHRHEPRAQGDEHPGEAEEGQAPDERVPGGGEGR